MCISTAAKKSTRPNTAHNHAPVTSITENASNPEITAAAIRLIPSVPPRRLYLHLEQYLRLRRRHPRSDSLRSCGVSDIAPRTVRRVNNEDPIPQHHVHPPVPVRSIDVTHSAVCLAEYHDLTLSHPLRQQLVTSCHDTSDLSTGLLRVVTHA